MLFPRACDPRDELLITWRLGGYGILSLLSENDIDKSGKSNTKIFAETDD